MDFLTKNLQHFEQRYPHYFKELNKRIPPSSRSDFIDTSNNTMEAIIGARMILCLGIGDAIFLQKIFQTPETHDAPPRLLIIEKSWDIVIHAISRYDLSEIILSSSVAWLIGLDLEEAQHFLTDYCRSEKTLMALGSVCRVTAYAHHDQQYYTTLEDLFSKMSQDAYEIPMAPLEDNYQSLLNVVRNIPLIPPIPFFDRLKGVCRGLPGVVIAAGPSLTQSLPLLAEYQEKAIYCCSDATLTLLLKHGINPLFVASLERVPESIHFFKNMPDAPNTYLVANPILLPEVLQAYRGPKCFLARDGAQLAWFFPKEQTHITGGSSATMAFWCLHLLGCDPILLVGQDLAFDRHSDRSHAQEIAGVGPELCTTAYQKLKIEQSSGGKNWIEGNDGQPILSWEWFIGFIQDYKRLIQKSGKTCINAIPENYGAKIPGSQKMNPVEAFAKYAQTKIDINAIKMTLIKLLTLGSPEVDENRKLLQKCCQEGHDYLANCVIPGILDIMQHISVFFQYHLPDSGHHDAERLYRDFFKTVEGKHTAIVQLNPLAHQYLVSTLTGHQKIRSSLAIAELLRRPEPFDQKIVPMIDTLQAYYREALSWACRVANLLKNGLSHFNTMGE